MAPRYTCATALLSLLGCEQSPPAEYPARAESAQTARPAAPVALESLANPSAVRWSSAAPASEVSEIEGERVVLGPTEHCKKYRRLPAVQFAKDTLVEDACLEIPQGTQIEVRDGATLAIIATNGLMIGKNVVFSAKGRSGTRGPRGEFASIAYTPATESEIQTLCVERGDACACPSDESSLAGLRGRAGGDGSPGGSVRLMAGELLSPSNLSGFAIDVTGGAAGPSGESGVRMCTRGALRCASPACAGGIPAATSGANGQVVVAFGGVKGAAFMQRAQAAAVPMHAAPAFEPSPTLTEQTAAVDAEAIQKGWQRRSGEDPY
jgi:hypothetical protein